MQQEHEGNSSVHFILLFLQVGQPVLELVWCFRLLLIFFVSEVELIFQLTLCMALVREQGLDFSESLFWRISLVAETVLFWWKGVSQRPPVVSTDI